MIKDKLNKKGFTLIELLAVIVILAIILVIVVPKIFDVIDNSKKKALLNSASGAVKSWETKLTSDEVNSDGVTDEEAMVLNYINTDRETWKCITTGAAEKLDILEKDYKIGGTAPDYYEVGDEDPDPEADMGTTLTSDSGLIGQMKPIASNTCSAIRYNPSGKMEILLIANSSGGVYTTANTADGNVAGVMWGFSDGKNSWTDVYSNISSGNANQILLP